jgi:ubiquinone biosynthesis monooxygenase Coq7
MRVNHCGEVAAQALYQGQALTARLETVRERMEQAALEENDHLEWCERRVKALGGHLSYLNPLWYLGSFAIGAVAGAVGDKWSLGFVAETEKQVIAHLEDHLDRVSQNDKKSRAVLEQMKIDEAHHGAVARAAGGAELPGPIKQLMGLASRVMTRTAYWV